MVRCPCLHLVFSFSERLRLGLRLTGDSGAVIGLDSMMEMLAEPSLRLKVRRTDMGRNPLFLIWQCVSDNIWLRLSTNPD